MPTWMDDDLEDRRRRGLYRVRRRLQSAPGARVRRRGREFLNFASNDYLNLAADPRLARAAARAARRYGCGAGASPLVCGHLPPHHALERTLADWEGTEAALVFSSGFAANLALVGSLVGRQDVVFSDELNHASLIDGCRLSRARVHVYRHGDANHLQDLLRREGSGARRRLIVSDTVFSMDGDLAPLADLIDLARRYDCLLLIDEAHATGVLGPHGRGATELLPADVSPDPDRLIKVGTLSKALGAQGGFVCGPRRLIAWLVNFARPYIYSTGLAPPVAAAARRAVAIVRQEPERRRHLLALAELLRDRLRLLGGPGVGAWSGDRAPTRGSRCQIVPLVVGEARAAVRLSRRLEERGLLVPAIRPPSVPEGTARLRISLTAGHTEEDVLRLVAALGECLKHAAPTETPAPP
ncbi:MAG TPA: 8-amino-7-oxononanoate synthase [Gemmataceae bacterium]|nr:8-amino-7-oxononanoate synthase [Gemmataceae bacterium]